MELSVHTHTLTHSLSHSLTLSLSHSLTLSLTHTHAHTRTHTHTHARRRTAGSGGGVEMEGRPSSQKVRDANTHGQQCAAG